MKRQSYLFTILIVLALLATLAVPALAAKRQPALAASEFSYFGMDASYGVRIYPRQATDGFVYGTEIGYQLVQASFYTIQGNAFVGAAPALTEVRGWCRIQENLNEPITAELFIDDIAGQPVRKFTGVADSISLYFLGFAQKFDLRLHTRAPLGCSLFFQKLQ